MNRTLFYFFIALGVLLGSVLITIALFMSIDINSYKSEIESLVLEKTGRKLHIEGEMQRSLFPWLGVSVGSVRLTNAPGFGDQDFFKISGAKIRIKVRPLFFGDLEVDVLSLQGLDLNLARNADGVTNWDDLLEAFQSAPAKTPADVDADSGQADTQSPEAPSSEVEAALSFGGIQVQDAQLSWRDEVEHQSFSLTQLNWKVSEIKADTPIAYHLDFDFSSLSPEITGQLSSEGTLRAELKREYYQLASFILEIKAQGEGIPGGSLDATLSTDINFDYKHQKINVNALTLKTLGLVVSATINGKDIMSAATLDGHINLQIADEQLLLKSLDSLIPKNTLSIKPELLKKATLSTQLKVAVDSANVSIDALDIHSQQINLSSRWIIEHLTDSPTYKGSLQLQEFNPINLMNSLGLEPPKTQESSVLQSAAISLNVTGGTNSINVTELKVALDKTHVEASVEVHDFSKPEIKLGMAVDRINLDHYLPPATNTSSASTGSVASPTNSSQHDVTHEAIATNDVTSEAFAPLKNLHLTAKIFVKALTIANAKLQYIDANIKAENGVIQVSPLKLNLYDGATLTNLTMNVQGQTPKIALKNTSTTLAIGPLLRDVYGDEVMSGVANMQLEITAQGSNADAMTKTLNGKGNFSVTDGVLDIDLETYMNGIYLQYKSLAKRPRKNIKKTAFERLSGSFLLHNGVMSNKDLLGNLRRYRINGRGTIDLPKQQIDYVVDTTVVKTSDAYRDLPVSELRGHTIPIKIRGSLSDPSIKADFSAVAKAEVKKALKKEQHKLEKKADKAIDKEVDKLEEKYDIKLDKLKKKLKDLF